MYSILLQQAAPQGGLGQYQGIIFLVLMVVVFYFFMIRPQQKKQKDQKKFIEEIKKGDNIVTIGGIHGKVTSVEDGSVTVDIDRGTKITLEKSAISLEQSKKLNA